MKNNRYAALKPIKNKFMSLEKMLKSFSDKELKKCILNCIHINNTDNTNDANNTNNSNNLNDTNDFK